MISFAPSSKIPIKNKLIIGMKSPNRIYDLDTMIRSAFTKMLWKEDVLARCNKWDKSNAIECYARVLEQIHYCGVDLFDLPREPKEATTVRSKKRKTNKNEAEEEGAKTTKRTRRMSNKEDNVIKAANIIAEAIRTGLEKIADALKE